MSVYTSITPPIEYQDRDTWTGAVEPWWNDDLQRNAVIDVATSPGMNTLVRVLVCNPRGIEQYVYLTCAQAVELRQRLQQAIDSIPDDTNPNGEL